jgi:hypothetical protein
MKTYKLTLEDKNGNELKEIIADFKNKKEAIEYAKTFKYTCMINDLKKIVVRTYEKIKR